MKVILAMDSFKGSLSAAAACAAAAEGVRCCIPDAEIDEIPLSDGGEGLVETLYPVLPSSWSIRKIAVRGPYGQRITCAMLINGPAAVIELAQCCGLLLQDAAQLHCASASSYGLGQALAAALDLGCRDILLGLGGSATNDGGAGFAQALGARFYDGQGQLLDRPLCGLDLQRIARIDLTALHPRLAQAHITGCCDVSNVLLGANGATHVFAPQKGAAPDEVEALERGMCCYAAKLRDACGRDCAMHAGSGAAGGLGAAVLGFCRGALRPGIDLVLELVGFAERLRDSKLVITGEGQIDAQSAAGKVAAGVARYAGGYGVPVVAVCGSLGPGAAELRELGITAMFSICHGPITLERSISEAAPLLRSTVHNIMQLYLCATCGALQPSVDVTVGQNLF